MMNRIHGNNWIELRTSIWQRLLGRNAYAVFDFELAGGALLLDRYFERYNVKIWRIGDGAFYTKEYPNCMLRAIEFRKKDENLVRQALDEMFHQVSLFDEHGKYDALTKISADRFGVALEST